MKKVLVTGGLGFIGSTLVKTLKETNLYDITVIDNLCSKSSNYDYREKDVKYIIDDINNLDNIKYQDLKFDLIFHLAGLSRIQPSFSDPILYFKTNTLGTVQVCELARRCNARVIYAASSSAEAGVRLNPYAFTKHSGEEILKMYAEIYNMSTVSTRFFNVYGPRQPWEGTYATVVGIFERQYSTGEVLTITGTGNQRRDFTHVYDICQGMICLSKDMHKGEIYNLGTSKNHSINELAKLYNTEFTHIPIRPGEAWTTKADITETQKYGYQPNETLEEYVTEWLTNNKKN